MLKNRLFSLLLFVLLGLNLFVSLWVQSHINHQFPSDINIYLKAGKEVLHNENPYQPFDIGASFVYPPTALLIFAPLSYSHYSREIWATVSIVSLLLVLSILLRLAPNEVPGPEIIWLSAGALFYAPFLEQLTIGQINSLVLLGMVVYILGVSNPRYKQIGDFGLAVAILIKISPLVMLAVPIIYRDWQRCIRIFLYLLILIFISVLTFGIMPWLDFSAVFPQLFQGYPGTINQAIAPSFNWLANRFVASANLSWVGRLFSILVLAIWVIVLFLQRNKHNLTAILFFGIVGMTISSSLVWYHHLVFLLAPIIFFILSADLRNRAGKSLLLLIMIGAVSINLDRVIEHKYAIPPFASIVGYLVIYLASGLSLFIPASTQFLQQEPASDAPSASRPGADTLSVEH